MSQEPTHNDELAAVQRMVDQVNAACDNFVSWLGMTCDWTGITDADPMVAGVFFHDEKTSPDTLNSRQREALRQARQAADEAHKLGQTLLPALRAAEKSINNPAISALTRAHVVPEPVQWGIDLRRKLNELLTMASWNWNDKTYTANDRFKAVQEISTTVNKVEHWLKMGAPGLISETAASLSSNENSTAADRTQEIIWSTYMYKSELADILDCSERNLEALHGDNVERKSRQQWRFKLNNCDPATLKRYETWRNAPRKKKKPRGTSSNSRKLPQTHAD